ncbi:MAG: tyrosine-type recombinase/integrase [Thaumarchaeota archaeon]|nr:tyrosine-type recombinase/integrase [Nitrososphaerota archaeon]
MKHTLLSLDEFQEFLNAIPELDVYKQTAVTPAMKSFDFQFLYVLAYFCALRVSEVTNLKKSDFSLESKLVKIRKKLKDEHTTIAPNLLGEIQNYIKDLNNDDNLFVSQKNRKPITRQIVWTYAKNAGEKANVSLFKPTKETKREGMLPSLFRDSYERHMLKQGADPDLVDLKLRRFSDNNYGDNTLEDLKHWEKHHVVQLFSEDEIKRYLEWYKEKIPTYDDLVSESKRILKKNINLKNIHILDIIGRVKESDSFENKIRAGIHYKPEYMHDLAGLRVICFVNSDVTKVSEIVESIFSVDKTRTKTREDMLGDNKMGYASTHYVCTLPKGRTELSENQHLKGKLIEIQIRTILQHAWSEIEHDDVYKKAEEANSELTRQFNLVSSILELADNELERLHKEHN